MTMPIVLSFITILAAAVSLFLAPVVAVAAPAQPGCVGEPSQTQLNVIVSNVRGSQGLIAVTIYPDDPNRFLVSHGSLFVERVSARSPVTRLCVYLPHPGTYAVAVYHDADGNHKLNRSLGLPTEAFGFSNNPSTSFGIPAFAAVRLAVPRTDVETRIRLTYP
jgi:uncharacterized protein (DUF2141 family)